MRKQLLRATQSGLSGAGWSNASVSVPAVITDGLAVVKHRPVMVTVRGIESVRNLGWSVGTTLAAYDQPGAHTKRATANGLRKLADRIEYGPFDNLGTLVRTELTSNLATVGIELDSIWRIP